MTNSCHFPVIFADSIRVQAAPVRYHRASAQEESDTVQTLIRHMRQAIGALSLSVWNVDAKRLISATEQNRFAAPRSMAVEYDDLLGIDDLNRPLDSEALARYTRFLLEAVESYCDRLSGHSTLRAARAKAKEETDATTRKKGSREYAPGFLYIDIKYLPQMPDETSYFGLRLRSSRFRCTPGRASE